MHNQDALLLAAHVYPNKIETIDVSINYKDLSMINALFTFYVHFVKLKFLVLLKPKLFFTTEYSSRMAKTSKLDLQFGRNLAQN